MLLGELLLGQLAGVVPGNPRRSLFCVAMPLALRGDSFHFASFSPTLSIVQMYPAYRSQKIEFDIPLAMQSPVAGCQHEKHGQAN